MKWFRYSMLLFTSAVSATVLFINVRLHTSDLADKPDIIRQLDFIGRELREEDLGDRMQKLFPEGFVFTNVLYGLSWCELALSDSTLKKRALKEAVFAYKEISSSKAKQTFFVTIDPPYGMFYCAWRNYLLAKIMCLDSSGALRDSFGFACEELRNSIGNTNAVWLQSYPGYAWPADMFPAIASLRIYDRLFEPSYKTTIESWLQNVKAQLNPDTKMLSHTALGKESRGSSMSLMIRLLSEIDPKFAKEQYALFAKNFVVKRFGLPAVLEYPVGISGDGDVDSGPVILGVGFSATIVGVATAANSDDLLLSEKMYRTIHAFGFSSASDDEKEYVFGLLPIADAFIAWGRTGALGKESAGLSPTWSMQFHLYSAIAIILLWMLFYLNRIIAVLRKFFYPKIKTHN